MPFREIQATDAAHFSEYSVRNIVAMPQIYPIEGGFRIVGEYVDVGELNPGYLIQESFALSPGSTALRQIEFENLDRHLRYYGKTAITNYEHVNNERVQFTAYFARFFNALHMQNLFGIAIHFLEHRFRQDHTADLG